MKVVAKRKIRYPIGLERTYAKEIVAHTKSLFTVIRSFLPRMISLVAASTVAFDDTEDELSRLMAEIAKAVESLPSMEPQVSKMYDMVRKHATNEIVSVFMSIFGAVPRVIPEPLRQDDELQDLMQNSEQFEQLKRLWVQENLDLIKSIDAESLRKIRETMADMILGTVDREELTRDLQRGLIPVIFRKPLEEIEKRERNRAALIGRDQVGKLNGRIAEYQQRQLGVEEYVWVTAGDERVRPSHRALNGHKIKWKEPPPEGHPGYPIQCRCIADPIIDIDKINLQPKVGSYLSAGFDDNDVEPHEVPKFLGKIDFTNEAAVQSILEKYEKRIAKSNIENAIVITKSGNIIQCFGTLSDVYPYQDLGDEVEEAIVTHNHPKGSVNEYSFGYNDLNFFMDHKLKRLRGIDEKYIYELTRNAKDIDDPVPLSEVDEYSFWHNMIIEKARKLGIGYRRWLRG